MTTFIGVDVGRHIGTATWQPETKDLRLATFNDDPDAALDYLLEIVRRYENVIVTVEDPNINRPVFARPGTNARTMMKIAQNVGAVKESTRELIRVLQSRCVLVERVAPRRGRRGVRAKVSSAEFRQITGYSGRSSQHARDAAMLVYDRSAYEFEVARKVVAAQQTLHI